MCVDIIEKKRNSLNCQKKLVRYHNVRNSIINRRFKYNDINATAILIIINVALFILENIFSSLPYYISMIPLYIRHRGWYWQIFTYMFSHVDFWHLFSNMLGLFIFGRIVERSVGSKEFLLYYLLTGTVAGFLSYLAYLFSGQYLAVVLGASGALYGIMLMFSVLFPSAVVYVFGIIPMRAPILVLVYFFIDFFGSFRSSGVAHLVHLFGLLAGYLYILIRMRINPLRQWGFIK